MRKITVSEIRGIVNELLNDIPYNQEEVPNNRLRKEPNYNMGDYVTLEEVTPQNKDAICANMKICSEEPAWDTPKSRKEMEGRDPISMYMKYGKIYVLKVNGKPRMLIAKRPDGKPIFAGRYNNIIEL